jgi:hypothetical protein
VSTYHPNQAGQVEDVQICEACSYVVGVKSTIGLKFKIACSRCSKPAQFRPPYAVESSNNPLASFVD